MLLISVTIHQIWACHIDNIYMSCDTSLSYIMQMTQTTKILFKKRSHGQKCKIWIFEWPSPSSSPEVVLHTFR